MSTNYRQARKDDSSDDEGPTKRVKIDEEDGEGLPKPAVSAANKKAASRNMWSDVVQEEELTMRSTVMDMGDYRKKGGSFVKVRRGAESYTVPAATLEENAAAFEAREGMMDELPAPTPSDDPFGDTVDLGEVEGFGVGPSSARHGSRGNWQPRGGRGRGVRGGWMNKARSEHQTGAAKPEGGDAMEMDQGGEGGDVAVGEGGNRGRGGRGGWRGGARGFVPRGHYRGGFDDRKRRWNNDNGENAKDPAELMDGGYSLETLLATTFSEGLAPKELGEQISKALGERGSDTVVKIVEAVGVTKAREIFEETKKAEQAGGVKTADGSRRRTPGGVFIFFFKADTDVDPAVKRSIFEQGQEQYRKTLHAKRKNKNKNKNQDVGQDLDELQKLLETKRKELQAKEEKGEAGHSAENEGTEQLDVTQDDETPKGSETTEME